MTLIGVMSADGRSYLEVEDVVDGLGGGAVGEGGFSVDHLVRYEPQGPPVTLHPVEGGLAPLHSGQDLGGQEVLGPHEGRRGHHLNNTPVIRSTEPDPFIKVIVFRPFILIDLYFNVGFISEMSGLTERLFTFFIPFYLFLPLFFIVHV